MMFTDYPNLADMSELAMQKVMEQLMDNAALTSLRMGVLKRDEMQSLFDLADEAQPPA